MAVAGYQLLRPEPVYSRHVPITTKIVFNREIAQIFQSKCFQCHTDGNVSVPLTTYKEARPWAVAIKEEILEKRMPPWGAASGYGHFANDMSLTGREISLILSWADGGAPSGVLLADEDKQPVFVPPLDRLGAGHAGCDDRGRREIRKSPPTRRSASSGSRSHRVEAGALAARAAAESRRIAARFATRRSTTRATGDGWARGRRSSQVSAMPAGSGVQLPAGAKLTVEIGYRGSMEEASGAGELGLYFRGEAAAQTPTPIEIARGAAQRRARQEAASASAPKRRSRRATTIAAMWPRLGPGARSIEVTAIRPDGSVEPMLWVNSYPRRVARALHPEGTDHAARGNAAGDDGLLRQHDRRGARREAVALDYCAATRLREALLALRRAVASRPTATLEP